MSNQAKNPNKQKQLTVSTRHLARQVGFMAVPEIRLIGKWLSDLGFNSGEPVKLILKQNKILIVANPKTSTYAKG
jgi:hypothetical protein